MISSSKIESNKLANGSTLHWVYLEKLKLGGECVCMSELLIPVSASIMLEKPCMVPS